MIDDETAPVTIVRPAPSAASVASAATTTRREQRTVKRERVRRRRRRLGVLVTAIVLLLGAVGAGGFYLYTTRVATPDYDGPGSGDVVVQVAQGATGALIGRELADKGVVASVKAFIDAADAEVRIRSVQPGFYRLRQQMSAEAAVELLLEPASRLGQLEIRGGVQLDDTAGPGGAVAPGVLTQISQATCAVIDGAEQCLSVEQLRAAMVDTDPAELGVPGWALEGVANADPIRRLEGLLAPGRYDVPPGESAVEVLGGLLTTSSVRLEATGLVSGAESLGSSPYEVLVISSLVEKEGITKDMPKVSRAIYNRLGLGRRLELDSTVNYPLDLQALATTDDDRQRAGPYNSYLNVGLPPTPIAAPGNEAITAALAPEAGPWLYFVRCETDGTSCFAETFAEHGANVQKARDNGAF